MSNFGGRRSSGGGFPFTTRDFGLLPLTPTWNTICAGTIEQLLADAEEEELDFGDMEEVEICEC